MLSPAEQLRAEAARSEREAVGALAAHHQARAALYDRCAEAFERLGAPWYDPVAAREREGGGR